jgi:tagatose 1,6-diphosphate aldolase
MNDPVSYRFLSVGRRRRLSRLGNESGIVLGLALDHRDSFRSALARQGITGVPSSELAAIKAALLGALVEAASALMLDDEFGGAALEGGVVPAHVGLIMPLEQQGYEQMGDGRRTVLMTTFTAAEALAMGADACKLLLPLRPDRREDAEAQLEVLGTAIVAAHTAGLPIVVEPVVYRLSTEDQPTFGAQYVSLLTESVEAVVGMHPDLLKLPVPLAGSLIDEGLALAAYGQLAAAADGVPWVLLGAGSPAPDLARHIRLAGRAGASGFLVGRTIWESALRRDPMEIPQAARRARHLFAQLNALAIGSCCPLPNSAGGSLGA